MYLVVVMKHIVVALVDCIGGDAVAVKGNVAEAERCELFYSVLIVLFLYR